MNWEIIETAPKDGTPFLGYLPQASWDKDLVPSIEVFHIRGDRLVIDVQYKIAGDSCPEDWLPTHWMPLPKFPEES